MKTVFRLLAAGVAAFGAGIPAAQACTWYPPVDLTRADAADLIVEGRVVDYTLTSFGRAVLRLDDVETIKGDASSVVEIALVADGPAEHFREAAGSRVIVGARDPAGQSADLAERSGGLPLVHVPICSRPFVIPANRANRTEIETAIGSGG